MGQFGGNMEIIDSIEKLVTLLKKSGSLTDSFEKAGLGYEKIRYFDSESPTIVVTISTHRGKCSQFHFSCKLER